MHTRHCLANSNHSHWFEHQSHEVAFCLHGGWIAESRIECREQRGWCCGAILLLLLLLLCGQGRVMRRVVGDGHIRRWYNRASMLWAAQRTSTRHHHLSQMAELKLWRVWDVAGIR